MKNRQTSRLSRRIQPPSGAAAKLRASQGSIPGKPKPHDRRKTEPVLPGLRQVHVTLTEELEDRSSWFADVYPADTYGGSGKWFFTVYSTASTEYFWRNIVDTSALNTPGELDLEPILSAPFKITDWKPSSTGVGYGQ